MPNLRGISENNTIGKGVLEGRKHGWLKIRKKSKESSRNNLHKTSVKRFFVLNLFVVNYSIISAKINLADSSTLLSFVQSFALF